MKIGEIKRQSLLLIFPEIEARFDSESAESVNEGIAALKCDPSIRSYLEAAMPSINRALCEIENAGATKTKHTTVAFGGSGMLDLSEMVDDLLHVLCIYQNGKAVSYSERDTRILLGGAIAGEIEIVYKSRVEKVRFTTEEATEIDLDFGVASLIPYFVASELCEAENGERAASLRKKFLDGLIKYNKENIAAPSEVEAVYSW